MAEFHGETVAIERNIHACATLRIDSRTRDPPEISNYPNKVNEKVLARPRCRALLGRATVRRLILCKSSITVHRTTSSIRPKHGRDKMTLPRTCSRKRTAIFRRTNHREQSIHLFFFLPINSKRLLICIWLLIGWRSTRFRRDTSAARRPLLESARERTLSRHVWMPLANLARWTATHAHILSSPRVICARAQSRRAIVLNF